MFALQNEIIKALCEFVHKMIFQKPLKTHLLQLLCNAHTKLYLFHSVINVCHRVLVHLLVSTLWATHGIVLESCIKLKICTQNDVSSWIFQVECTLISKHRQTISRRCNSLSGSSTHPSILACWRKHSNHYFINAVNIVQHKFQIVEVSWNEENGAHDWMSKITKFN